MGAPRGAGERRVGAMQVARCRWRRRGVSTAMLALGAVLAAVLTPAPAAAQLGGDDEVVWLCRPGTDDDPCEIELDTTVRGDGDDQVVTPARPAPDERSVDCFYVYPTVSNQPTPSSDRRVTPELRSIASYQAARFSSVCRPFAPVYRQRTVTALLAEGTLGIPLAEADELREIAYGDVLAAWRRYLEQDNDGRGVVLLGHSQGSSLLNLLLQREIEPDPAQRELLAGAVLLGSAVLVPRGQVVGGDLEHVPLCRVAAEAGCVLTYASYAEDPPDDSRFGRAPQAARDAGLEVGCTDPGALLGRSDEPFGVTLPTAPFAPGFIALTILQTNGGPPPSAPTTWVTPEDRYVGGCTRIGDAHVLRYDPTPGSSRPNPSPDETWGTHVIDANLGLDRLVALVEQQAATWTASRASEPGDDAPGSTAPDGTAPDGADDPDTATGTGTTPGEDPPAPSGATDARPGPPLPVTGGSLALGLLALGASAALRRCGPSA